MFGIGFFELVIIAVVALIFVGPKKLPELMKQAGKFFVHMRRTANDVRGTFDQVVRDAEDEIRREQAETMRGLLTSQQTGEVKVLDAAHQSHPPTSSPAHPHEHDGNPDTPHHPGTPPAPDHPHTPEGSQPFTPGQPPAPDPMAGEAKQSKET